MLPRIEKETRANGHVQELLAKLRNATTLMDLVTAGFRLGMALAVIIIEEILNERGAAESDEVPSCPECGTRLRSRGLVCRKMMTLIGRIAWKRRAFRCRNGCKIGLIAPLDRQLGIRPYQNTGDKLKMAGCVLAVFIPFGLASRLMKELLEIEISSDAIWNWVQYAGEKAATQVANEQKMLENGTLESETMDAETAALPMAVGADGVMVPFRPHKGTPNGRIEWKEVKVGVVTRLGSRLTRKGKKVSVLIRRRLTAVRGKISDLKPRMQVIAFKERAAEAEEVVWISDGGPGFWRMFREAFSHIAHGVLDFYHAAQNLGKGAHALYDPSEEGVKRWFQSARRTLLHEGPKKVLELIETSRMTIVNLSDSENKILDNLKGYIIEHLDHMDYPRFRKAGLPIGSGMMESACKWLIQQRYKCVGMRWSEEGFNNLLHLRLAWVNGNFREQFEHRASPNL